MAVLRLKKNEERRLLAGHLWVFSNEIDTKATSLGDFEAGQSVCLESSRGAFLGHGYVNPHSLIAARICSRDKQQPFNADLIRRRINFALALRTAKYPHPYYRLVHGEGDLLPGLIIDRYDDVLVLQINTAGMELLIDELLQVLVDLLAPRAILLRNDSAVRKLEALPEYRKVVMGDLPDVIQLRENGLSFLASLGRGQKTGWFYDHRENRAYLQQLSRGKCVLDVYAYIGGWGLNAAVAGARKVTAIDASEYALQIATDNAKLNGVSACYSGICGDAVEIMRELQGGGQRFDIVILDPPAFMKRKKDRRAGLQQYELINRLAVSLLKSGGLLVSASCSQHLLRSELANAMLKAARKNRSDLQFIHQGGQGADHPVNAAMPETDYLKAIFSRMIE